MMQYAPIVSAILAGLTLALVFWMNFGGPYFKRRKMQHPVDVTLVDELLNMRRRIVAPTNSVVLIQIQISPRLHYREDLLKFGFHGDVGKKPFPIGTNNRFVKVGTRTDTPEANRNHFVDVIEYYHIKESSQRTAGNSYQLGFDVKTRGPGEFQVFLQFKTESGHAEIDDDLYLIVEDQPANPVISSNIQT